MNFTMDFGPFDTPEEAVAWLNRDDIRKAGVRGVIRFLVPPDVDGKDIWDYDRRERAKS
jgi:hypothetical protein